VVNAKHRDAHERLTRFMKTNGLKVTRQREAILDAFLDAGGHVSVEELLGAVRKRSPGVGHATVYRAIKLFVDAGVAQEHKFTDGATLYEPASDDDDDHHDHLICTKCGKIVEFENDEIERLQEVVASTLGFRLVDHRMQLYGACIDPTCKDNPEAGNGGGAGRLPRVR
jgi:Fur family ferric uptake transcriptional regulator